MTEEQYRQLCIACDELLLKSDVTKTRIAIAWLHILREHPLLLARYKPLFAESAVGRLSWRCCLIVNRLRYRINSLLSKIRARGISGKPWWSSTKIEGPIDLLFVSHFLHSRLVGTSEDFYFGNMPTVLMQRGLKVAVVYINHTNEDGKYIADKWAEDPTPRIALANLLNSSAENEIQTQLQDESHRLTINSGSGNNDLAIRVMQQASVESLSGATRTAVRQSIQFELLIKALRPRVLVTTFEGHSWERLAYAAAHESDCNTLCVGYIQGALSRLQHAVKRNFKGIFDPDVILTAGKTAISQLRKPGLANNIPMYELGSNRWIEATTYSSLTKLSILEQPCCLVVPEGIIEECCSLFLYSLDCALAMPAINFIWRLHPLITFEMLRKADNRFKSLPDNIVLSENEIETDLPKASWSLYRGSTAIVQCGASGLRPIYLALPDELSFDALYELKEWRREVKTVRDLYEVIQQDLFSYKNDDVHEIQNESEIAISYIREIYTKLQPKVLEDIAISVK